MRVMVFGTFDPLHPGHLDYFRQARRFGDELIVVVARDNNVSRFKGRPPRDNEKIRVRAVRQALKEQGGGRAVLGGTRNIWLVLKKYRPDVIALGYDQKVDLDKLKSEIAGFRLFCKVKRLKPHHPEKYKSSLYKKI